MNKGFLVRVIMPPNDKFEELLDAYTTAKMNLENYLLKERIMLDASSEAASGN